MDTIQNIINHSISGYLMGSMVWDLGIGISNGCRSLVLESAISAVYLPFCFVVSTISTIVSAVSAHFGNIGIETDKVYGDISNHDGKFSAQIECSVSLISSPGWIRMGLAMRKNRHCMIFQTILPLAKNHISCIIQWYRKNEIILELYVSPKRRCNYF